MLLVYRFAIWKVLAGLIQVSKLIEVEVANWLPRIRRLFGLLNGFGELLGHHVVLVFFGLHGLREDGLAPGILLLEGFRGSAEVLKGLLAGRRRMRNHRAADWIHLQHPAAIRAHHFKWLVAQSHNRSSTRAVSRTCWKRL